MATLFYSWQSDTESRFNRTFIKDALEKAIESVGKSLNVEEAPLRLDQDTAGVPGSPDIAKAILDKIDACSVFVPDLTIVAHTADKEPMPNANVLIELGYAMKAVGTERIVAVMNEVFGSAEDGLPFDLKHRRWPIRYYLGPAASRETRAEQKQRLIAALVKALTTIINAGLLENGQAPAREIQAKWESSSFLVHNERVARLASFPDPRKPQEVIWKNGPQAFLRLIPLSEAADKSPTTLLRLFGSCRPLAPMGQDVIDWHSERNSSGAVAFEVGEDGEPSIATHMTQVFRSGEIWGIDGYILRYEDRDHGQYIPSKAIEMVFNKALANYVEFMRDCLELKPPLRFVAGLSQVRDFPIATGPKRIEGSCVEDEVIRDGVVNDYETQPAELLLPFYRLVWDSCGLERPDYTT